MSSRIAYSRIKMFSSLHQKWKIIETTNSKNTKMARHRNYFKNQQPKALLTVPHQSLHTINSHLMKGAAPSHATCVLPAHLRCITNGESRERRNVIVQRTCTLSPFYFSRLISWPCLAENRELGRCHLRRLLSFSFSHRTAVVLETGRDRWAINLLTRGSSVWGSGFVRNVGMHFGI